MAPLRGAARLAPLWVGLILALAPGPSGSAAEAEPATGIAAGAKDESSALPDLAVVARIYYGDRERLAGLVSTYDVFEFADHEQGYVLARLEATDQADLAAAGFRVELDESQTAELRRSPRLASPQLAGIPLYPCYRTVPETYAALDRLAAQHPGVASLVTIGQSWEKAHGDGTSGQDLRVLVLSSRARSGPKAKFFLLAAHHARELSTAETATRFAEELVAGYGVDPDATWLLDYHEIHILPQANPDGRRWAELGYWWRKNTSRTNGCTLFPQYGTDLNRNAGFYWGGIGSSELPCNDVYRGPAAFSEPENQAIRDYVRSLFPPQREPDATSPAPTNATGLLISLHSYSELVLYPWGWTTNSAPNQAALATLGGKFGYFNRYAVQPSTDLYPTTGSLDDWAYGELGVATYTFEIGRAFFESCSEFTNTVYPRNRGALWYAAKACRQPYLDPAGPDVVAPTVAPSTNLAGVFFRLTAQADATRSFGTKVMVPVQRITAARYTLDEPSWVSADPPVALAALDGTFDSPQETVGATIDTAGWAPGRHTVFVEAQGDAGVWGVPTAAFVWIEPLTLTATSSAGGLVLRWPGLTNRTYSVVESPGLDTPFTVLAADLPSRPPFNTFTALVSQAGTRFYQVRMEP